MKSLNTVICKVCDYPLRQTCVHCRLGVCESPDCCIKLETYDEDSKSVVITILCSDCVTIISSSITEIACFEEPPILCLTAQSK